MPKSVVIKWLHAHALPLYRVATWAVIIGGLVFTTAVLGARYWLLPHIGEYRERIAQELSEASHQRITIGNLSGRWQGLHLILVLDAVTVYDTAGQPALALERIENALSWWSLVYLEPRLHSIEIDRPVLNVTRDADGTLWIAGIKIAGGDGGGFSDWLLRQDRIVIRNAQITWQDDLRRAPALQLANVDFRLDNSGQRHRFGLRAVPPAALAAPLDVRGDLRGETVTDLNQWHGQLFAQLDYVNIPAWRTWIPFPVSFPHGVGAARIWLGLADGKISKMTADTELSQVRTQLRQDLPELNLHALKGRIAWMALPDGFELTTSQLGLITQQGLTLAPTDFSLRWQRGSDPATERGQLRANEINIAPLQMLADHLPIDATLRVEIAKYAPRGSFYDTALQWQGSWPQPAQYSIKSRFTDLGLKSIGRLPGFSGVSGEIDGSERGGTLELNMQNATAELPLVFRDKIDFDSLSAKVVWDRNGDQYDIKLNDVTFSNADLAGTVFGTYRTAAGRGTIDLSGNLTRADARRVPHYIPLQVTQHGRDWLDGAFVAGDAKDVRLRLKGNLDEFPFVDGKNGLFRVAIKVAEVTLNYAAHWPRIENLSGEIVFTGHRMEINAREASIFGAKLTQVHAEIPNLMVPERMLSIAGQAEGPTNDFLDFIAQSPRLDNLARLTAHARADGRGLLALKLLIPLQDSHQTQIAGSYQFIDNRIVDDRGVALDQVNGTLEFTEAAVRAPRITLNFLGGPATLTALGGGGEGTRVNLQGRANLDNYHRSVPSPSWPWLRGLSGSTDWKASLVLHEAQADGWFESTLRGLASSLPPPLVKKATDPMPLKLEWHRLNAEQDRFVFALGTIVNAQWTQQADGTRNVIARGNASFGGAAPLRDRGGVTVNGVIPMLDLDGWGALTEGGSSGMALRNLTSIDLKIGATRLLGRPFHDLAFSGGGQRGTVQIAVSGPEIAGDIHWNPQGRGRLQARLKQLTLPAAADEPKVGSHPEGVAAASAPMGEYPTLDLVAENFTLKDKALGRLEVIAQPDGADWRIDKLKISNPDATLLADGVWQNWRTASHTEANLKLEVTNAGKLLTRLGQPEGIKRGSAQIDGELEWDGAPFAFDYRKISGHFVLDARKGQFLKLDPGVGRLLGILSLQSLPRRITLDFRDIFSQGFAFDEIVGAAKFNQGLASTENLRIQGPAARISMNGSVDLVAETQKLHVKVYPSFSDSLSVAGALIGGPIAGIASFLVQKALKDPIDQMAAYEYDINGTWSEPKVSKTTAKTPTAEPLQ